MSPDRAPSLSLLVARVTVRIPNPTAKSNSADLLNEFDASFNCVIVESEHYKDEIAKLFAIEQTSGEFVWMMDQESQPSRQCLLRVMQGMRSPDNVLCLSKVIYRLKNILI